MTATKRPGPPYWCASLEDGTAWTQNKFRKCATSPCLVPLSCTMKVIAVIEDEEVISWILSWILSHLNLLAPGDGPRAPPREALSGSASRASGLPKELTYEPIYSDLSWPDPA